VPLSTSMLYVTRISVCAPYWMRQGALDRMGEQYARLYPDLALELVVCDDGSPKPAVAPPGVTVVRLPRKNRPLNPCVPINAAVNASTGDVIVLTNPEIEHREPVLGAMLAMLEHEDDYVTARCWDEHEGLVLAGPEVDYRKYGRQPVPPGAHFHFLAMFHRSLWERAGGFDEDYRYGRGCDDNDWLWRAHRANARFKACPVTVYHDSTEQLAWKMPLNRDLFRSKWPGMGA
jgi:hypothetical protein